MRLQKIVLPALCVLLAACAPGRPPGGANTNADATSGPLSAAGVRIQSGAKPIAAGYYVVLNKVAEGEFRISSVLAPPAPAALAAGKEMLVFDEALTAVQPAFQKFELARPSGNFNCSTSFLDKTREYTPCKSDLTRTADANVGTNIAGVVLTGGITVLTGARFWEARTDEALVQRVVSQPGFMEQVRREATALAGARSQQGYRRAFEQLGSVAAVDAFVKRYANEDPDGLVPKAKEKRRLYQYREDYARSSSVAELQGFISRNASWDPEGLVPIARRRAADMAAQAAKREAEAKRVAAFRRALKAGAQTNCGRVVSVRAGTATVAGSGWTGPVSVGELMPTDYPCTAKAPVAAPSSGEQRDAQGRQVIRGPVGSGVYTNVRIISDSVGVRGDHVSVMNSVIEAPVCVSTSGMGVRILDSELLCGLCIEFTGPVVMDNQVLGNRCAGRLSNHPEFQ